MMDWSFFSSLARLSVLYAPDRGPKPPWISRYKAYAVPSFPQGKRVDWGSVCSGRLLVGPGHPCRLLLASG